MDVKHPSTGGPPSEPGPIPFSVSSPEQALEGTISINLGVGSAHAVALEIHLAGERLGSAALTEESALDLALRLIGTIMDQRRAARVAGTIPDGCF